MEFFTAIILIVVCRIIFEYLDMRYRQSLLQSDLLKAFYISKNFRVKNKYMAPTYKAFQHFYRLSLLLPRLVANWLHH